MREHRSIEKGDRRVTECEEATKLAELDRILNDPDVPMEPARVWALLAEIARPDAVLAD